MGKDIRITIFLARNVCKRLYFLVPLASRDTLWLFLVVILQM